MTVQVPVQATLFTVRHGTLGLLHVLIFSVFFEVRVREMAKRFESCETQKATRSRETEALRLRCKQYLSTYFASKRENTLN